MTNSVDEIKLFTQIALFCRRAFEQGATGRTMAARLGLVNENFLGRVRLGFAEEALLGAIPSGGVVRDSLLKLGFLTREGKLAIANSLVVPILDRAGNVIGLVAVDEQGREKRFPAALSTARLNHASLKNKPAVMVDSIIKALRYLQAGVPGVVPLGETPGQAEESILNLNRPQKTYCDADGPAVVTFLQGMELPCYGLKISWPATLAEINAAMNNAEPIEAGFAEDATVKVVDDTLSFKRGGREYEIRDLEPDSSDRLRVRIKAAKADGFHLDTLDLYAARSRAGYAKAAAALYGAPRKEVESDLCLIIRKLEAIHAAEQRKRLEPTGGYVMTADEEAEALEFLKQPDLLDRIVADMGRLGYVGEEINKKLGYLIAISRKLDSPLSSAILSRAGAGKSSLMDVLADMTPPDELVRFTRITPQALYYAGRQGLRHKLLMCAEDEGLTGSDYVLRELISAKRIRLATPLNDAEAGKFRTVEYEVEGPIALLFTTTRPAIHFENATRCFTISLDESFEQTRDILKEQRRRHTLARIEERPIQDDLRRLHRNAQRLLRPLVVINHFAPHLEFPTNRLEMRREHEKYLSLIDAIALLHQRQREVWATEINGRKVEYIEVTVDDVEEANRLMTELMGTSREELSRPSRELLGHIKDMVEKRAQDSAVAPAAVRFNRRDIREHAGWSDSQIKAHIRQLEELEYLLVSKGERGRLYRYELAPEQERKRLPGLTDVAVLRGLVRKSGVGAPEPVKLAPLKSLGESNESVVEGLKVGQVDEKDRPAHEQQEVAAHA